MPSLGQRPYSVCRAAPYPRAWPPVLTAAAVSFTLVYLFTPPVWAAFAGCLAVGFGVAEARWALWRWRHPRGQCALCQLGRRLKHVARQREVARWQ
jgi:hypothetical protein